MKDSWVFLKDFEIERGFGMVFFFSLSLKILSIFIFYELGLNNRILDEFVFFYLNQFLFFKKLFF
jgi:hypothetical protein